MQYRETTVFGKRHTGKPLCSDPMIQHIILRQIGLRHEQYFKHAIQGDHYVWETPYRETTVFRSHDSTYYTTLDWLGPKQTFQTWHTGRPLCLRNAIHGDHCVRIP